jgi:hypothetical protein
MEQALSPQLTAEELNGLDNLPSEASNDGGLLLPGVVKQWGLLGLLFPDGFFTGRGNGTVAWGGLASDSWHSDVQKGLISLAWTNIIGQDDPVFNNLTRYPIEEVIYSTIGNKFL